MNIEFIVDKEEKLYDPKGQGAFLAMVGDTLVGKANVFHAFGAVVGITWLYQTDDGKALMSYMEYAEAFFAFLKAKGCTEVFIESEEDRLEKLTGFELHDWDNSGWYPKYYFRRML